MVAEDPLITFNKTMYKYCSSSILYLIGSFLSNFDTCQSYFTKKLEQILSKGCQIEEKKIL